MLSQSVTNNFTHALWDSLGVSPQIIISVYVEPFGVKHRSVLTKNESVKQEHHFRLIWS